jgi:hypothetical protein
MKLKPKGRTPVREVFDATGERVIKRFKIDMVYHDGYVTEEDARDESLKFKRLGYRTFIFTPDRAYGARGYPYNLWVSSEKQERSQPRDRKR